MVERETVYASGVGNRFTCKNNKLHDPLKIYITPIGGRGCSHTGDRAV